MPMLFVAVTVTTTGPMNEMVMFGTILMLLGLDWYTAAAMKTESRVTRHILTQQHTLAVI